jgi:hypothetical protein
VHALSSLRNIELAHLFDHLIGVEQEVLGNDEAQSLRYLEIDDESASI